MLHESQVELPSVTIQCCSNIFDLNDIVLDLKWAVIYDEQSVVGVSTISASA